MPRSYARRSSSAKSASGARVLSRYGRGRQATYVGYATPERGIAFPTIPASGTGTRTRFSPQDVLRVVPGSIVAAIGSDRLTLPWLETALGHATQDDSDRHRDVGNLRRTPRQSSCCTFTKAAPRD
jgi:hypothetical protein